VHIVSDGLIFVHLCLAILWDVRSGGLCHQFKEAHASGVRAVSFSPDGQFLSTADNDGEICIWDMGTGRLFSVLKGHSDSIYSLDWDMNSKILASGSGDTTINIWDCTALHSFHTVSFKIYFLLCVYYFN
jgi:WD40 repeat protein